MLSKRATLIACHHYAVDWCGGLTEELFYDNPKTVALKRDWESRVIAWHPQFWDLARYDGFTPCLCRPYRAQTKDPMESGVKDVKRRFGKGHLFPAWAALNPTVQEWIVTVADQRLHGTTFRKPTEAFAERRAPAKRSMAPARTLCST
jgi:transposase